MDKESPSSSVLTVVGIIGSMLLFAIILGLTYIPSSKEAVNQEIVDKRLATRASIDAAGARALDEAALIDVEKKIYKIPVEQAVGLTIAKLRGE